MVCASARAGLAIAFSALAGGAAQPGGGPRAEFMVQRVDHFDPQSEARWSQPLFVNDTFWRRGSRAPVFLCLGGEGPPLDGSAVRASVHCNDAVELLRETGALMIALEHRYYSESRVAGRCVSARCEQASWLLTRLRTLSRARASRLSQRLGVPRARRRRHVCTK
jgi:hypothetical protein